MPVESTPERRELLATAAWLAAAARCAYAGHVGAFAEIDPLEDPHYLDLGLDAPQVFTGRLTDTHGYVATGSRGPVLIFRGSCTIPNWLVNLTFDRVPCTFSGRTAGRIHAGFASAWQEVRETVLSLLPSQPDVGLTLAGHSLGGALAVLAGMDLAAQGYPLRIIHTFGAPRVGDAGFSLFHNLPLERWVNAQDPVPLVPWSQPLSGGYRHAGRLHFLTAAGELATDATIWHRVKEQVAGLRQFKGPNWSARFSAFLRQQLADHDIDEYLRKLERLAGIHSSEPEGQEP